MLAQALHICAVFWQSHLKDSTYSPGSRDSGTSTWSPNTHLSPLFCLAGLIIVHCDPSGVVYLEKSEPWVHILNSYNFHKLISRILPDSFLLCPLNRVEICSSTCVGVKPLFCSSKVQIPLTETLLINLRVLGVD